MLDREDAPSRREANAEAAEEAWEAEGCPPRLTDEEQAEEDAAFLQWCEDVVAHEESLVFDYPHKDGLF